MDLKFGVAFGFILVLVLSRPILSQGIRSNVVELMKSDEIYEIDYRGPETHSKRIPPPDRSGNGHFNRHKTTSISTVKKSSVNDHKFKGL
ncbi:hypothetical protein MKW98_003183 [Papaver atlanticum]|uniref:Uncharacterized protein n=1 Tax=Papaver atlanticum TaxID=357466 RepID=A0AAD4THV1_9MAGN|nr:hypothetical protein MKW98_003183 [Papaver atlanticum]